MKVADSAPEPEELEPFKVISDPVRRPFTRLAAFSWDPANIENCAVIFPAGVLATAGEVFTLSAL